MGMIEIVKEGLLMCLGIIGGDMTVNLRCMVCYCISYQSIEGVMKDKKKSFEGVVENEKISFDSLMKKLMHAVFLH